jgi:hypothetical protein
LIPNDPDIIASAYTNDPSASLFDSVTSIPWQLPNEHIAADNNPMSMMNEAVSYNPQLSSSYQALPEILRSLNPSILAFLANNEAYVSYLLREDGSIDESRLRALQVNILGENHASYHPQHSQMTAAPATPYVPITSHYSAPMTSWSSIPYTAPPPATSYSNPSYSTFSVPSLNQLTGSATMTSISSASAYQPSMMAPPVGNHLATAAMSSQKDLLPKKGAKGSVACRMFNTPEGCRFGDRCDFAHIGVSGVDILRPGNPLPGGRITSPAMAKNRIGPDGQHRRGPGGR